MCFFCVALRAVSDMTALFEMADDQTNQLPASREQASTALRILLPYKMSVSVSQLPLIHKTGVAPLCTLFVQSDS